MLNLPKIKADHCKEKLREAYRHNYSDMEKGLLNVLVWTANMALENIANSDALYHDMEHTIMVTLAGQSILEGKHIIEGGISPRDWVHFMIALLCHDIGYVKGVCSRDAGYTLATGIGKETVDLLEGSTDAILAPFHIDRSKCFVRERFGEKMLLESEDMLDAERIAEYIEMTRFPIPDDDAHKDTAGLPGLVRAADFIGQLADPNRRQKCTALFYEFEEMGLNSQLGYKTPGDLRGCNARFYWKSVNPYIQEALRYLRVTQRGKQWISNLQANVFGDDLYDKKVAQE